jgi:hypothetical protein
MGSSLLGRTVSSPRPSEPSRQASTLFELGFDDAAIVRRVLLAGMRNRGYPVKFTGENRA